MKPRTTARRIKKDELDRLYAAVGAWAEKNGGRVVVAGGVEVQQWLDDPRRFTIGIKCLGTAPRRPK